MTAELSRRGLFTSLPGWLGIAGYPASRVQAASNLALRSSAAGEVDLDSTAEQCVAIVHGTGVRPATHHVVLVDVVQDDATVDSHAVRWAPGYPIYDEALSDENVAHVRVRFALPAEVPATARARILFEI